MDYREALSYIYGFTDYEKKGFATYAPEFYDLARVHHLLSLLGDPHHRFRSVHIAGTKGKGSTAAMIESVLRTAGYRTGLYTSPHMHTFRERIRVGGIPIPEESLTRLAEHLLPMVSQVPEITTFEIMTALAFQWFAEQGIEWAVVEVGLGGRLDATNVITPAVSVITSLSLDHTTILGDTLAQIAGEKAGIIKRNIPVVSAPQKGEALAVLEETCRRQDASLTLVGRDWTWEKSPSRRRHGSSGAAPSLAFSVRGGQQGISNLRIPLLGDHQLENATTAIATIKALEEQGVRVGMDALRQGLRSVNWPGRLEILGRAPLLLVDSAHNGDSAEKLIHTLKSYFAFERLIVILGASADHATPQLLQALVSGVDSAIATQARHPRAAAPEWLQAEALKLGLRMEISDSVSQALDMALAQAGPNDLICGTGSIFVAAELRAIWFVRQGLPAPPIDPA